MIGADELKQTARRRLAALYRLARNPAAVRAGTLLGVVAILGTCSPEVNTLRSIQESGQLRVATLNSATTYYLASYGPTGFEYDLAKSFATWLGAEPEIIVAESVDDALAMVRSGRAHYAAGFSPTVKRERRVRFGPPVYTATPQLVYRKNSEKPSSMDELKGKLEVLADSSQAELLEREYPQVDWEVNADTDIEGLLYRVGEGEIDYTIANSNVIALNARYFPEIGTAFDVGRPESLAWAFRKEDDNAFFHKAIAFIAEIQESGELTDYKNRYFKRVTGSGYVGGRIFAAQVENQLPKWRAAFMEAGQRYDIDWRLLAAVGYQESHWQPLATSPTGVRGLMMLTNATADFVNISNRLDPYQSIDGGARYLKYLESLLPEEIEEPDRTWITLASYNIGWGHIQDVRELVKLRGGNPNRWLDIRDTLPLLTQSRWNRKTKYGYARGYEAVTYVANIRSYYDILRWMTTQDDELDAGDIEDMPEQKQEPGEKALDIDTPIL